MLTLQQQRRPNQLVPNIKFDSDWFVRSLPFKGNKKANFLILKKNKETQKAKKVQLYLNVDCFGYFWVVVEVNENIYHPYQWEDVNKALKKIRKLLN
ncbi:MAG: hypothetical protein ACFFG0_04280 [Candidatus Thorarchaeota archaeon]